VTVGKMKNIIFLAIYSTALLNPSAANATVIASSLGFSEAGDDVPRPTAAVVISDQTWVSRVSIFGRDFAKVQERTLQVSYARKITIFNFARISNLIGIALLDEYTKIETADSATSETSTESKHNLNAGLLLGLEAELFNISLSTTVSFAWTSSVYLAGFSGFLLAHSRMHAMHLGIGVSLD